jgi:hypothetical protein
MLELFKRMWVGWNGFARRLISAQNTGIMTLAYLMGIGPVAIAMRLTGRKLLDHRPADPSAPSYWLGRDGRPMTMEQATRRY